MTPAARRASTLVLGTAPGKALVTIHNHEQGTVTAVWTRPVGGPPYEVTQYTGRTVGAVQRAESRREAVEIAITWADIRPPEHTEIERR